LGYNLDGTPTNKRRGAGFRGTGKDQSPRFDLNVGLHSKLGKFHVNVQGI